MLGFWMNRGFQVFMVLLFWMDRGFLVFVVLLFLDGYGIPSFYGVAVFG